MTAIDQLACLDAWLSQLRSQQLEAAEFSLRCRGLGILRQTLAGRYVEVLDGLLDRLEAGALFTEESCSFSASALHDSLALWVDKARGQLVRLG
jgi:hypothetical protein